MITQEEADRLSKLYVGATFQHGDGGPPWKIIKITTTGLHCVGLHYTKDNPAIDNIHSFVRSLKYPGGRDYIIQGGIMGKTIRKMKEYGDIN